MHCRTQRAHGRDNSEPLNSRPPEAVRVGTAIRSRLALRGALVFVLRAALDGERMIAGRKPGDGLPPQQGVMPYNELAKAFPNDLRHDVIGNSWQRHPRSLVQCS